MRPFSNSENPAFSADGHVSEQYRARKRIYRDVSRWIDLYSAQNDGALPEPGAVDAEVTAALDRDRRRYTELFTDLQDTNNPIEPSQGAEAIIQPVAPGSQERPVVPVSLQEDGRQDGQTLPDNSAESPFIAEPSLSQGDNNPSANAVDGSIGHPMIDDELIGSSDLEEIVQFGAKNSGEVRDIEHALLEAGNFNGFLALQSGHTDAADIERARAQTQNGGCAAINRDFYLCNPKGDEIGEYVIPKLATMPALMTPRQGHWHRYRVTYEQAPAIAELKGLIEEAERLNPVPGPNSNPASREGTRNDAGIVLAGSPVFGDKDQVVSYLTRDTLGNQIVVNVTIPGEHLLTPGIVSQSVIMGDSHITVLAIGEGNGQLSRWLGAKEAAQFAFWWKMGGNVRRTIHEWIVSKNNSLERSKGQEGVKSSPDRQE